MVLVGDVDHLSAERTVAVKKITSVKLQCKGALEPACGSSWSPDDLTVGCIYT